MKMNLKPNWQKVEGFDFVLLDFSDLKNEDEAFELFNAYIEDVEEHKMKHLLLADVRNFSASIDFFLMVMKKLPPITKHHIRRANVGAKGPVVHLIAAVELLLKQNKNKDCKTREEAMKFLLQH